MLFAPLCAPRVVKKEEDHANERAPGSKNDEVGEPEEFFEREVASEFVVAFDLCATRLFCFVLLLFFQAIRHGGVVEGEEDSGYTNELDGCSACEEPDNDQDK